MKYSNFLYTWTLKKASHKNASWFLAFISFIESFIFPIPPDIVLIPMVLSKKEKAIVNIQDSLRDMILPLINLDRNVFPENILIPQEKIKKLEDNSD